MAGIRNEERMFSRVLMQTVFLIIIVGVLLLSCVAVSAITNSYGYNLMQVKRHVGALHQDNEQLRLDIAKMKTPDRIYSMATKDLGMVAPTMVLYRSTSSQEKTGEYGH